MDSFLDAKQVKTLLRCSLPLVYRWAERGQLASIRIPCPGNGTEKPRTLVRFKQSDVFEFIESHYNEAKE